MELIYLPHEAVVKEDNAMEFKDIVLKTSSAIVVLLLDFLLITN